MVDERFKDKVMPLCGSMFRFAMRLTGDQSDAEDAVQDAMVRLWERRNQLEAVDNIKAYALMTVRNCCLDIISRRIPKSDLDQEQQDADAFESFETIDRVKHAIAVINALPQRQAEIMTMRDINGCSVEEIQKVTGLTAVNIRVLLCRARNSVRQYFSNK